MATIHGVGCECAVCDENQSYGSGCAKDEHDCEMQTVQVFRAERTEDSGSYDVYVSSGGVRFEFGPRRMKVFGVCTDADVLEFVKHVRFRTLVRGTAPIPLVQKRPAVKVMGVKLG